MAEGGKGGRNGGLRWVLGVFWRMCFCGNGVSVGVGLWCEERGV